MYPQYVGDILQYSIYLRIAIDTYVLISVSRKHTLLSTNKLFYMYYCDEQIGNEHTMGL